MTGRIKTTVIINSSKYHKLLVMEYALNSYKIGLFITAIWFEVEFDDV